MQTLVPTLRFRFVRRTESTFGIIVNILQQGFVNSETGEVFWQDVPVVDEE